MKAGGQNHVIGRRTLHLGLDRAPGATGLMDRASGLWRTRLAADAEMLFSAGCSPFERVRLERIELELGTIPESDFETEFPVRFRAALERELARQLSELRTGGAGVGDVAPVERSELEVLEHVLLHGMMPWWGPEDSSYDPAQQLAAMLRHSPERIATLARKIGGHARVRFRLVHWLDDPAMADLVRAIAAGDAAFILRYAEDLTARQEEERIVASTAKEFRHAKWEVILAHLLADRGSRFNTKSFLRQTLQALAGRFRVEYALVLGEFVRIAVRGSASWREVLLPQLLEEIFTEDVLDREMPRTDRAWIVAWLSATRENRGQWPATRLAKLAFWRHLPTDDARRLAATLATEMGRDSWLAALAEIAAPDEAARVRSWEDTGPAAEETDLVEQWLARWDGVVGDEAAIGSPEQQARLSFWRFVPEPVAQAIFARLIERYGRRALSEYVSRSFPDVDVPVLPADPNTGETALPGLRMLFQTGSLPSAPWAARWRQREDAWLRLMLVRHAEALPSLLRAWARADRLARTIPGHFSDSAIVSIVEILEPAHAEEIQAFVEPVNRQLPALASISIGAESFRSATWTVVLDYLFADRGSVFNTRSFLEHSIDALAVRYRLQADAVLAFLVTAAERDGKPPLLRDLHAIAERRRQGGPGEESPARESPSLFTAENVRRSPLIRLRLLRRALGGKIPQQEAAMQALLPELWDYYADADAREAWREVVRESLRSSATPDLLRHASGKRMLLATLFEGEPAQAEIWLEAVSWLQDSAAAAALFPGGRAALGTQLWLAAIELWREGGARPIRDVGYLLERVLLRLGQRAGHSRSSSAGDASPGSILDALHAALQRDGSHAASRIAARIRPRPRAEPIARRVTPAPQREDDAPAIAIDEPIAVSNAGLVLLAPFFPELHKRCGFLEGGLFRNFEANQQAVHLLQYLVNAGVRTHEYSLVLNKVLCGLDPQTPVVPQVSFDEDITGKATGLLETVAKQWPRGASISIDGIRSTYLHRPGRLKRVEHGWSLKVESRGWDILLGELPWSFGRVHPAWMPGPLLIDWI